MRLIRNRLRALATAEGGYTLIAVLGATFLVTLLVTAALAATNDDQRLISLDLEQKRAYASAQAGIADYTYHLNNDSGY
jgi:Tfp pilus assembly protein PilX